ncbi:MAG: hypothetical protein P8Q39_02990, partial [Candidatus Thalassarchaeaceae archaeon]|nr:hypothetical protein [Candidatus Thalassarchaeaceae archaeon]
MSHTIFGKDAYNMNFAMLMILTLIVSFFIDPGSNYNSYPYLVTFLILFFCRPTSKISIYLFTII